MYFPYFYTNSSMLILIPGILLMLWAQWRVRSVYAKYSQITARSGQTATQIAKGMLQKADLEDVGIEYISGPLGDHYDPRSRILSLSTSGSSQSVAAIGVAAHEVGHAIQHAQGYWPLKLRTSIFPVVNISSMLAIPLLVLGYALDSSGLVTAALVLYASMLFFQFVTLPIEFNASSRAKAMLADGVLSPDELEMAGSVLNAAALTYLASALVTFLQFARLLSLSRSRR